MKLFDARGRRAVVRPEIRLEIGDRDHAARVAEKFACFIEGHEALAVIVAERALQNTARFP